MTCRISVAATLVVASALLAGTLHAQTPVEKAHVVIASGANAGTYDVVGTRFGCSANATGPGSFGNQLSDSKGAPDKFNSLQLIVPSAKAASAGSGTTEFQIVFGFGPLMHRTKEYEVNTLAANSKKTGSGTVKVVDSGATAKVDFAVTTAAGVKITGTINCNTVTRL